MSRNVTFTVAVPTDAEGFVGRACDAPTCKQYFKIYVQDHREFLHCPYCGTRLASGSLLTSAQLRHVNEVALEEARIHALNEFQKMMKSAFSGSKNIAYKPAPRPRKKDIKPRYAERDVDTEFQCADCATRFQVYGIFGYCPGCGCENLQVYDANWANIKRRLTTAPDKNRQLRHAYGDLVSTFEMFCNRTAKRLTSERGNFQVLFDARRFFKTHARIDIFANVSAPALLALRRVFQKRHVCIHAGGEITERYVTMIPEDTSLLGSQAVLTVEELEEAATAMRVALVDLIKAIEDPG